MNFEGNKKHSKKGTKNSREFISNNTKEYKNEESSNIPSTVGIYTSDTLQGKQSKETAGNFHVLLKLKSKSNTHRNPLDEMHNSLESPLKKKKEMTTTPDVIKDVDYQLSGSGTTHNTSQGDISNLGLECNESLTKSADNDKIIMINAEDNKQPDYEEKELTQAVIGTDTLNYLISREHQLAPDPYYFNRLFPEITSMMRSILLDWMMEVCMEFKLKRETFHLAASYVDRYLSLVPKIERNLLQLIGVTSLWIASKMEEVYPPKVADFAKSTDDGYTITQMKTMELHIYSLLKWSLAIPTLNMWSNWYIVQWDTYILKNSYAIQHPLIISLKDPHIVFKEPTQMSYARYRELMQIIDVALLDSRILQYLPRTIIAASLYIVLAYHCGQATKQQIALELTKTSYFIDKRFPFNDLFDNFLVQTFGFQLEELLPAIQFMGPFMGLQFCYNSAPISNDIIEV